MCAFERMGASRVSDEGAFGKTPSRRSMSGQGEEGFAVDPRSGTRARRRTLRIMWTRRAFMSSTIPNLPVKRGWVARVRCERAARGSTAARGGSALTREAASNKKSGGGLGPL